MITTHGNELNKNLVVPFEAKFGHICLELFKNEQVHFFVKISDPHLCSSTVTAITNLSAQ